MEHTRIKICGITRLEDAELAVELGAWAIGMIFYEGSERACSPEHAELICRTLRRRVQLAGVFVNASLEEIARVNETLGLSLVQLHGDEGPAFCSEVARRTGAQTIKAMGIWGPGPIQELERFHTDFHLLDGHAAGMYGGTGASFDWTLLSTRHSSVPAIISGGLSAENVGRAIAASRDPFAVDVASGVEASPGIKHPSRLRDFFDAVQRVPA